MTIDGGAGNDTITAAGAAADSIVGGSGDDSIVSTGAGDDSIDAGAGNDKVFASSTGEKIVYGGTGNDLLVHATAVAGGVAGGTASSLVGAEGDDTIVAGLLEDTVVGGAGKDVFVGGYNGITISDYKVSEDVVMYNAYGSASAKVSPVAANFNSDGTFSDAAGKKIDVSAGTGTTGYYAVTLVDGQGKNKQIVGWSNADGGTIDASTLKDNLFLVSNNNDAADLVKGGTGKDTITAGNYDSVVGGAGNDSIVLAGTEAAYVGITKSSGKDTVTSFRASFGDTGDQIVMMEGTAKDISLTLTDADNGGSANDVTVKLGSSSMLLQDVTTTGDVAEVLVSGSKAAVAAANATINAASADYASFYFGKNSMLNFAGTDDNVSVDLRDDSKYRGISTLQGGTGASTLMGSTGKDLIISAGGETSLWGGAGADSLQGASNAKDVFFFTTGDGKDTIGAFDAYTADTADVLNTNGANITSAQLVSNGLQIGLNDSDKVIITSITDANNVVQFTQDGKTMNYAKVGAANSANTFTNEEFVNAYVGGSQKDTLSLSGDTDTQVWLDGSKGKSYASIDVIDGASASGTLILAGATGSETVVGGSGSNSLWDGSGNMVDVLESNSSGTTTFFYGFGEGNDVINANGAEDTVNLYNINLSDVKSGEITGTGVNVEFNDGTKLTVNTTRNVKFSLASGESYIANQSTKQWDNA